MLHVLHVGQRYYKSRPQHPRTYVTMHMRCLRYTLSRAQDPSMQDRWVKRMSKATRQQRMGKQFHLCSQRSARPCRSRQAAWSRGAASPYRATSSRGRDRHRSSGLASGLHLGVIRGLPFTSISTAFSHGFLGPRVPCASRARHRGKKLLTAPASPAPATAQAGALARRNSSVSPHQMH